MSTNFSNSKRGSLNSQLGNFASTSKFDRILSTDKKVKNTRPISSRKLATKPDLPSHHNQPTPLGPKKNTYQNVTQLKTSADAQFFQNPKLKASVVGNVPVSKVVPKVASYSGSTQQIRPHMRNHSAVVKDDDNQSINKIPLSPIGIKRAMDSQLGAYMGESHETGNLWTEGSLFDFADLQSPNLRNNEPKKIPLNLRDRDIPNYAYSSHNDRLLKRSSPCGCEILKSITNSARPRDMMALNLTSSDNDTLFTDANTDYVETNAEATPSMKRDSLFSTLPYRSMSDLNQNTRSLTKAFHTIGNSGPNDDGLLKSPRSPQRKHIPSLKVSIPNNENIEPIDSKTSLESLISPPKVRMAKDARDVKSSSTLEGVKSYLSKLGKIDLSSSASIIKQIFQPSKRLKCSCDYGLDENQTCSRAIKWITKKYSPNEFSYLKATYEKISSEKRLVNPEQSKQIQKDLHRTYPQNKFFLPNSPGVGALERILNAFAKYDPQIGYVQGMNFIAASLLYHAEEYLTFWLLVMIFEVFEMRDIYLPSTIFLKELYINIKGLPGLSKHCQIIDMLILNYQHITYKHLCQHEIRVETFCTEWILALFASVIPVENMVNFYDMLLEEGWPFFYKIILAFLQNFAKQIKEQDDLVGILTVLKSQNHLIRNSIKDKSVGSLDWNSLFQKAQKMEIDSHFVYKMHSNFDVNNQWFRTTSLKNS